MWEWCGEGPGDSVANFLRGVRSIWILKMRRYSQGEKEDGGHSRTQEERRPNHGSIGVRSLFSRLARPFAWLVSSGPWAWLAETTTGRNGRELDYKGSRRLQSEYWNEWETTMNFSQEMTWSNLCFETITLRQSEWWVRHRRRSPLQRTPTPSLLFGRLTWHKAGPGLSAKSGKKPFIFHPRASH